MRKTCELYKIPRKGYKIDVKLYNIPPMPPWMIWVQIVTCMHLYDIHNLRKIL